MGRSRVFGNLNWAESSDSAVEGLTHSPGLRESSLLVGEQQRFVGQSCISKNNNPTIASK